MKNIIPKVFFILGVMVYVFISQIILKNIHLNLVVTFKLHPIYYTLLTTLFSIIFGFIMGLYTIINHREKEEIKIKFNFNTLIIIGLPLLYFSLFNVFPFLNFMAIKFKVEVFNIFMNSSVTLMFQVMFGYIVAICFYNVNGQ